MNSKQKSIQTIRQFIQHEFNNRQRVLKEPRRTQAMQEAQRAMAALDELAKEITPPQPAQLSFGELMVMNE